MDRRDKDMKRQKSHLSSRQEKSRISDVHIRMARELGMNPKKLGNLANHKQEQWKLPLPDFIEGLYFKRFRKERPDGYT